MHRVVTAIRRVNDDEQGHIEVGLPALVAGIAAIVLAVGAAADSDVVTIISGGVLGISLLAASVSATARSTTASRPAGQAREVTRATARSC